MLYESTDRHLLLLAYYRKVKEEDKLDSQCIFMCVSLYLSLCYSTRKHIGKTCSITRLIAASLFSDSSNSIVMGTSRRQIKGSIRLGPDSRALPILISEEVKNTTAGSRCHSKS